MADENTLTRRELIKRAAYIAPTVAVLNIVWEGSAEAKNDKDKDKDKDKIDKDKKDKHQYLS